ncbi:MAG: response regulator [Candidatus Kapabacteria bacterium]|jgi:CheY-like chemotaxis protein|nr:response regulator [Candidatus Kapabacteria bacterium]
MITYSVLIIDDDVWMQRILSKTLSTYGFKQSYLSSNGFDGIAKAVEYQPSLIVLDILMPDLSGHLTLKVLKSIKMTKEIPVIMVSALSDMENLGKAVKSGTAGFISKPFTRATVYEKLLDVYGREKLDLISKGKSLQDSSLGYYQEGGFGNDSYSGGSGGSSATMPQFDEMSMDDGMDDSPKSKGGGVSSDQLAAHYQDSDRQSIDSIKKLLMKGK